MKKLNIVASFTGEDIRKEINLTRKDGEWIAWYRGKMVGKDKDLKVVQNKIDSFVQTMEKDLKENYRGASNVAAKYNLKGVDEKFNQAFSSFMEGAQAIVDEEYNKFPNLHPKLAYDDGKRYVRVTKNDTQTSAFCFIDKKEGITYGMVLKADGWRKPALGSRGNIFDGKNGLGRMTPYGPQYNR